MNFLNNTFVTLEAPVASSDRVIFVKKFVGNLGENFPISAVLVESDSTGKVIKREIIRITGKSDNMLNVERAIESCPQSDTAESPSQNPLNFSENAVLIHTLTAGDLSKIIGKINEKLGKSELRAGFDGNKFLVIENGEEVLKTITQGNIKNEDIIITKQSNGDFKEISIASISEFVLGGETKQCPIVEVPPSASEKNFIDSSINSAGINCSVEGIDYSDDFFNSNSAKILQTYNNKSNKHTAYLYFNQKIKLREIKIFGSGYASLDIFVNGEIIRHNLGEYSNDISFSEREVKVIQFDFYFRNTSSSQTIYINRFLISGKMIPSVSYAYSLIESGVYQNYLLYDTSSSNTSTQQKYGVIVEFPMNVKIQKITTKTNSTSTQARIIILDNENSQIAEFAPIIPNGNVFASDNKIELQKNTKYKILCNNSENFGRNYRYGDINYANRISGYSVNNFCDFLKGGYFAGRESGNIYEITSISLEFESCLVLSKSNIARYDFVGMVQNPELGQIVAVSFIDEKVISGFEGLQKGKWYYLNTIGGLISTMPERNKQKFPIGYAVSDNLLKVTTKGSPQHFFNSGCFIGTGDLFFLNEKNNNALQISQISDKYVYESKPMEIVNLFGNYSITM